MYTKKTLKKEGDIMRAAGSFSQNNDVEETLLYPQEILLYLREKLNEQVIECFEYIANSEEKIGFIRTSLPDYRNKRRLYEVAFVALEAQGFIREESFGTFKPFVLTVRGKQLKELLEKEI